MTAAHARHAPISIPDLRDVLSGQVIAPDDAAYDQARTIFYGGFDQRPAAIVRVAAATDVSRVVSFARDTGLELAVRSGGHSLAGHSTTDGGIVLDLRDLRALDIDVQQRTAWAETGLTAGEYSTAAGAYGLATGFGDTGSVGIGGITLGGGVGYLVRKHGLTIDSLLAAELVTADGQLLHVDDQTHPDLFWAIRGGGGNFGVATRFQFRLHQLRQFVGGLLLLPATPAVIAAFVAQAQAAPAELSTIANVMPAPPLPFVPAEQHGRLVIMATLAHAGDVEAGQRAVAPCGRWPPRSPTWSGRCPTRRSTRPSRRTSTRPRCRARCWSTPSTATWPKRSSSTRRPRPGRCRWRSCGCWGGDGARARRGHRVRPPRQSAHGQRDRSVRASGEAEEHRAWVDRLAAALRDGAARAYVNFLGDEGQARIREAYPGPTWDRLAAIKTRYDPTNLFRRNQNIPPTKADR